MKQDHLSCPSASQDLPEAMIFGVVLGSSDAPEIAYLATQVRPELVADTVEQDIDFGDVFRLTARCAQSSCGQWDQGGCRLGRDIAKKLEPVVSVAPACTIRASCRWFAENKIKACIRCPQITTHYMRNDLLLRDIAADIPARRPKGG